MIEKRVQLKVGLNRRERDWLQRLADRWQLTLAGAFRRVLEERIHADPEAECSSRPPHFTSQDCSACGVRVQKSLSVRTHVCPGCGYVADRDTNAALNIKKAGLKRLAQAGTLPSLSIGEGSSGNTR